MLGYNMHIVLNMLILLGYNIIDNRSGVMLLLLNYCYVYYSPRARNGHSAPPLLTHTNKNEALICPKHEMRCYQ